MQDFDAKAAEAVLRAELEPGERLEWAGRPGALTLALQQLPGLIFFALWLGGVGYDFLNTTASNHGAVATALGFLLLAIGLFGFWNTMISLIAAWQIFYGVTDRRLLMLVSGPRRRITSWMPQQITSVQRRDRRGGRGDVIFHQFHQPSEDGQRLVPVAFVDVAEVRAVEACIRRFAAS